MLGSSRLLTYSMSKVDLVIEQLLQRLIPVSLVQFKILKWSQIVSCLLQTNVKIISYSSLIDFFQVKFTEVNLYLVKFSLFSIQFYEFWQTLCNCLHDKDIKNWFLSFPKVPSCAFVIDSFPCLLPWQSLIWFLLLWFSLFHSILWMEWCRMLPLNLDIFT